MLIKPCRASIMRGRCMYATMCVQQLIGTENTAKHRRRPCLFPNFVPAFDSCLLSAHTCSAMKGNVLQVTVECVMQVVYRIVSRMILAFAGAYQVSRTVCQSRASATLNGELHHFLRPVQWHDASIRQSGFNWGHKCTWPDQRSNLPLS